MHRGVRHTHGMSQRLQVLVDETELDAIRQAARHHYPTADIDQMLAGIERVGGQVAADLNP